MKIEAWPMDIGIQAPVRYDSKLDTRIPQYLDGY